MQESISNHFPRSQPILSYAKKKKKSSRPNKSTFSLSQRFQTKEMIPNSLNPV